MKMQRKVFIILINLMLIVFIISSTVFAEDLIGAFQGSINTDGPGTGEVKDRAGRIVGIIQVIGTMVSVGMLMILGIKYMLGSADQKAEYRKSMLPYIVGSVLIFGFSNITQWIYTWARNSVK